ncbi:hypothetical protein GHK92_11005 [Nocardioides sp. dk4132]|uniref:hypothetical protein n=1 Tax=unclassified Nocardioides TaxID=2615069 RepID=UPI0012981AB9|nr:MULTISPECIES: hypothetical protein [unclassified Nocardioides]MQW76406.1 hypothetical protein [Nocardioides sp. dk4132]QGA07320.1 hypothetical protein GFH29_07925 [Nocardioides sp. dk884]
MSDWIADPRIRWRILLTARLAAPLGPSEADRLGERLQDLVSRHGWPDERPPARQVAMERADDVDALRARLAEEDGTPVVVGMAGQHLVVSAHHAWVDGLGLLDVLAEVTGTDVSSGARGVSGRPRAGGFLGAAVRRLGEVAFTPPARLALPGVAPAGGDAFAVASVPGHHGTARLVHAASAGLVHHNRAAGRRTRHVAIAIGAARREETAPGTPRRIADRSELLRLRGVEDLDLAAIERLVREAPTQPPVEAGGSAGGRVVETALRVLAPRLGSSLLVSHLGQVQAPGVDDLAFHPVTAGGTGLSLGAVGIGERTVLGLRGRRSEWDDASLTALLQTLTASLTGTG